MEGSEREKHAESEQAFKKREMLLLSQRNGRIEIMLLSGVCVLPPFANHTEHGNLSH